jgi:hypothetical protein
MSSNWIIGITIAAIAGIFATLYLVSSLERIRTQRSIQIGEWQDRAHRLQHLIISAPNNALTSTVKKALFLEIKKCLQAILKLDEQNASAKRRLTEIDQALENIDKESPATLKLDPIPDANALKTVRKQLTDLFNFVQAAAKTQTLDGTTARKEFETLKHLFTESGANFYLTTAKNEEGRKKYRLALHLYKMAIGEYRKENKNNLYDSQINAIQKAIANVDRRQNEESQQHTAATGEKNDLASAMEQIQNEEDEQWQKKKF